MVNTLAVQDTRVALPEQEATIEERTNEILSSYQGRESELIPILQRVQEEYGYLPEPAIKKIAKFLHLPEITVFGVATFYAQFKLVPTGRNVIKICRGTACHVRGAARILTEVESQLGIKAGETTADLEYSLETVACFGACAMAPVMVLNNKVHGNTTAEKAKSILNTDGRSGGCKNQQ